MQTHHCSILTMAPYRLFPHTSGGPVGIIYLHHYIGRLCPDHIVSTRGNDDALQYAFDLHKAFSDKQWRYLPMHQQNELIRIAKTYNATAIVCEHPYMALSAMALAKRLKIPWFIRSHNIESERFRELGKKWWPILRTYERFAMRQANGIFFITGEDAKWAEKHFELPASKCHFIPYGTIHEAPPTGHEAAKQQLAEQGGYDATKPFLYFIGALDYFPNTEAVANLINEVAPRLNAANVPYQLLIAGKGMPEALQQQVAATPNVAYTGFIPKLETLLNGCDIMLNPMLTGGGIKSKAVEALGYNKIVISTVNGAAGLLQDVCGHNLQVAPDRDWDRFAALTLQAMQMQATMPQTFYETYYWGKIAEKVVGIVNSTSCR